MSSIRQLFKKAISSSTKLRKPSFFSGMRALHGGTVQKKVSLYRFVRPTLFSTAAFASYQLYNENQVTKQKERDEFTKDHANFSQWQVNSAAIWWAQYLDVFQRRSVAYEKLSDEQIYNFVNILSKKIMATLKVNESWQSGMRYMTLGDSSSYNAPKIVIESLKEANINTFVLFPPKTEMRIYENGNIQIGHEIICTNPSVIHYDSKISFDTAPLMKVTGDKFRIVEVKEKETALPGYAAVYLKDFKKSEAEFLKLTNEEWANILQDPELKKTVLKEYAYVKYNINKNTLLSGSYTHIGDVVSENIGDNYYQQSTGIVKIISAKQEGTIFIGGSEILNQVKPKDFVICDQDGDISYLPVDNNFEARMCDSSGNYISGKIYKAGVDEIPLQEKPVGKLGI